MELENIEQFIREIKACNIGYSNGWIGEKKAIEIQLELFKGIKRYSNRAVRILTDKLDDYPDYDFV